MNRHTRQTGLRKNLETIGVQSTSDLSWRSSRSLESTMSALQSYMLLDSDKFGALEIIRQTAKGMT